MSTLREWAIALAGAALLLAWVWALTAFAIIMWGE